MYLLIAGLLLVGALLIVAEAHVPGHFICGVPGCAAIIAAVIITLQQPFGGFLLVGEIAVLGFGAFLFVKYVKRKQLYGKLILNESLEFDENNMGDLRFFIGKEGVARTVLKPIGTADFNGQNVEVYAEGAFIDKNARIKVIDATKNKIIVREINNN